jgi:hypothetical protein
MGRLKMCAAAEDRQDNELGAAECGLADFVGGCLDVGLGRGRESFDRSRHCIMASQTN